MGYKNSPGFFQRLMDKLLASFRWQSAIAYIDDLIIWPCSIKQHVINIAKVLKVFQDKGLTLAASKAHAYVELLGNSSSWTQGQKTWPRDFGEQDQGYDVDARANQHQGVDNGSWML